MSLFTENFSKTTKKSITRKPVKNGGSMAEREKMETDNTPIGGLSHEVFHNRRMDEERKISDERYAEKRVQHMVYGGAVLMFGGLITLIVKVVTKS